MHRDGVARAGQSAVQSPRLAACPLHQRAEADRVARLHHLLGAEPAAIAAGAAGVRPQAIALHQQRILGLDLFGGAVVGVAVIHRDHGVAAVAVVLGAPAATDETAEIDIEAVVLRPPSVDAADAEIGVMAGDHLFRQRRGERLEDRIDDRHRIGHPHSHRRGLHRADHAARRQHDIECAELPLVDRQVERRGQALERHLRAGIARGDAGVVETRDLFRHAGEVDRHAVAGYGDLHADRHALADVDAVVVHERFGLIDAIGHGADPLARHRLALVHDGFDAVQDLVAAVFADHVHEAPLASFHRRELGAEIAHGPLGQTDVHLDQVDQLVVRDALAMDLDDRHLQAFGVDA